MSADSLAELSIILFFAIPLFKAVFIKTLSISGYNGELRDAIGETIATIMAYIPLLLACIKRPDKYIKLDFWAIWLFMVVFFAGTLFINPDYGVWYAREHYGIWDHAFIPNSGVYAYLFIRLCDDPKKLMDIMRKVSWIGYLVCAYEIYAANRRGFWYGVVGSNNRAEFTYSIAFGYEVLTYALIFIHSATLERKATDIIGGLLGLYMILKYGSRGPVLFVALYFAIYFFIKLSKSARTDKKIFGFTGIVAFVVILGATYEKLVALIVNLLSRLDVNSRFINSLIEGDVADDHGRSEIWAEAVRMIKDNPFGYGAMGSQHRISKIIFAGYPHSIVLEILIDFGIFFGGALLIFFAFKSVQILLIKRNEWSDLFLPFFCSACSLFLSMTFWSTPSFWISLGIGVSWYVNRGKNRNISVRELGKRIMKL